MRRERLKKLTADVRRQFPPPRPPGHYRVVHIHSPRCLTDEELERKSAKIPREPGEVRIIINVIDVRRFSREGTAEHVRGGRTTSPTPARRSAEEEELERRVRELEAKKARLLEERARECGKKPLEEDELSRRRRRLADIGRAARDAEDRERNRI